MSVFSSIAEKGRRAARAVAVATGLETHAELGNAINELVDVREAYQNVARQRTESAKYLGKWNTVEAADSVTQGVGIIVEETPAHMEAYQALDQHYAELIASMREILKKEQQVHKLKKNLDGLKDKFAKGKVSEGQVEGAETEYNEVANETFKFTSEKWQECSVKHAQAEVEFYKQALAAAERTLERMSSITPVVDRPEQPAAPVAPVAPVAAEAVEPAGDEAPPPADEGAGDDLPAE